VPSGPSFLYMAVRTLVARGWRVRGRIPLALRPDLAMLLRSIVRVVGGKSICKNVSNYPRDARFNGVSSEMPPTLEVHLYMVPGARD
jgi:hypothetical protein